MRTTTSAFFCFAFAQNIFFHPLTYSLYVSLSLRQISCRKHIYQSCFCIPPASLFLLVCTFNLFTFIYICIPIAIFSVVLGQVLYVFCIPSCFILFFRGLMTTFSIVWFAFSFVCVYLLYLYLCVCIYCSFGVCCQHEVLISLSMYILGIVTSLCPTQRRYFSIYCRASSLVVINSCLLLVCKAFYFSVKPE